MDRVIHNTAVLIMGDVPEAVYAGLREHTIDTLLLSEAAPGCSVTKFIRYAAGNIAGIFGFQADDRKLIVNTHGILLSAAAAKQFAQPLSAAGVSDPPRTSCGQVLLNTGEVLPGVYLADEAFDPTQLISYVQQRINHFKRAGEVMNRPREIHIGGEYALDILRPKLKVLHKLLIQNDNGHLCGTHITENDSQPMQDLRFDGEYLSWNAYSGTTSSELFTYKLQVFDDILLGATWRIDGDQQAPFKSPVLAERRTS